MGKNYEMIKIQMQDILEENRISIPKFQRGIVWKLERKRKFIETVMNGDPYGVVLVYKEESGNSYKYQLVDGLQRLTTLKEYSINPFKFVKADISFDKEEVLKDAIKTIVINGDNQPDEFYAAYVKQIKETIIKAISQEPNINVSRLWNEVKEEINKDLKDIVKYSNGLALFETFIKSMRAQIELPNEPVNAIAYTGSKENLPSLFSRLNTGAVTLSKYEIFSSTWNNKKLFKVNSNISKYIINRYKKLKRDSSFEIDIDFKKLEAEGITIFEYCYSVGQMMIDANNAFSVLFNPKKKSSIEPVGFDFIAILLDLKINEANEIDRKFSNVNSEFLNQLSDAIYTTCNHVYVILKNWITQINNKTLKLDSTYQIFHILYAYFNNNFDIQLSNNKVNIINSHESKKWNTKFDKYLHKNFLNDLLRNHWGENRQVNDLNRELHNNSINNYTKDILGNNLYMNFITWENNMMKNDVFNYKTPNEVSKYILNYYYRILLNHDRNKIKYFEKNNQEEIFIDIEHIVPKKKFENFKKIAISHIGNLCYLPMITNRSKRDKTLYENSKNRPSFILDNEFLETNMYPKEEELNFLDTNDDDFIQSYNKFVSSRSEKIFTYIKDKI